MTCQRWTYKERSGFLEFSLTAGVLDGQICTMAICRAVHNRLETVDRLRQLSPGVENYGKAQTEVEALVRQ